MYINAHSLLFKSNMLCFITRGQYMKHDLSTVTTHYNNQNGVRVLAHQ